jgi:hypothetical protein
MYRLTVNKGNHAGASFELKDGRHPLGRRPENTIRLTDALISGRHAEIVVAGDRCTICDVGSRNGTRINGQRIQEETELCPGDTLELGGVDIQVEEVPDVVVAAAAPAPVAPPPAARKPVVTPVAAAAPAAVAPIAPVPAPQPAASVPPRTEAVSFKPPVAAPVRPVQPAVSAAERQEAIARARHLPPPTVLVKPIDQGSNNPILDVRGVLVGIALFLLIAASAAAWHIAASMDPRARRSIEMFEFTALSHNVEQFQPPEAMRPPIDKESMLESPNNEMVIEEKPKFAMSTNPIEGAAPPPVEVIQIPNPVTQPTSVPISPEELKNFDPRSRPESEAVPDGPVDPTFTAAEPTFAMNLIGVEVPSGGELVKYDTPTPRDRLALGIFNTGPPNARPMKIMLPALGPQDIPMNFGEKGAYNIYLNGTGRFLRLPSPASGLLRAKTAVDSALRWLARHQDVDGSWHTDKYEGQPAGRLGCTGLASLAFLSGGHTTRKGEHSRNVLRALEFIMRNQKPDGHITLAGANLYTHAICTIALCEAYGRARDERIGGAAQKALDYCQAATTSEGGWRYSKNHQDTDMSVTGWFIQAIKTARMAQMKWDPAVYARAIVYVDSVTDQGASKDSNGLVAYQFKDGQSYSFGDSHSGGKPALTAAAMMVRQFNGMGVKNHILVKGAEAIKKYPPTWGQKDFYYWYYATYAMHNMSGEYRIWWNERTRDVLLTYQSREGDNEGSWDPKGDHWAGQGGRVYTTSLGALCLEVYYRYSDALTSFTAPPDIDELLMQQ